MYTIKNETSNELVVKGSRFICALYHIEDIDDVDNHLDYLSKKYKDATHICFAYRLDRNEKFSKNINGISNYRNRKRLYNSYEWSYIYLVWSINWSYQCNYSR